MKKDLILGLFAVALLAGSVFFFMKNAAAPSGSRADFPDGTHWVCKDDKTGVTLSIDDLGSWFDQHPDTNPTCPQCGKNNTIRGSRCPLPECRAYYVGNMILVNDQPACPICKKPVP